MCRQTINREGISYRTTLFTSEAKVKAFASCLEANSRFTDVQIIESARAKSPKWFVTFKPSNQERYADMAQREWDTRLGRATQEGMDYIFLQKEYAELARERLAE